MKKHSFLIICITILGFITTVNAQNNPNPQRGQYQRQQLGLRMGEVSEKVQAQKIAYITNKLELTPEEAKAFWPVYNEYEAKRKEIRRNVIGKQKEGTSNQNLTEDQASNILNDQIIEAQRMLDLRKEYLVKFKAVLPAVKVLKLMGAERDFQRNLVDRLRQGGGGPHRPANPDNNSEKQQ